MTGPVTPQMPAKLVKLLSPWGAQNWNWKSDARYWHLKFWNSQVTLDTTFLEGKDPSGAIVELWTRGELRKSATFGTSEASWILDLAKQAIDPGQPREQKPVPVPLARRLELLIGRCKPKYGEVVRIELEECVHQAEEMQGRIDKALRFVREMANKMGVTANERQAQFTELTEILEPETP